MPSSVLVRVVFGVLVLATAAAFLVAQRLKRSTPIVEGVYYRSYISPTCRCPTDHATIYFSLPKAGHVTATVVDSAGDDVRTLVDDRRLRRGRHHYVWNGRADSGVVVADGVYHLRVTLRDQGRSVTLGRRFIVDTVPPHPRILSTSAKAILPGAPGSLGRATIRFRGTSNPPPLVQIWRTDLPKPRVVAYFNAHRGRQTVIWPGTVNGRPDGAQVPDGIYAVTIKTWDRAGNAGTAPPVLPPARNEVRPGYGVSVWRLTVSGTLDPVRAGSVARFNIGPVPRRLRWSLGPTGVGAPLARGRGRGPRLAVRVPSHAATGLYLLRVEAAGHRSVQPLVVQGSRHGRVLVVLPAIAWQGTNAYDDDGDGFANLLTAGDDVRLERPFAHGGAPPGLTDRVAPLLRFLAREHARYDITTDLALAQGRGPGLAGHSGVLFAGDETWLTNKIDLAFRDYVDKGGRVASFGTDAFRRRVSLGGTQLTEPTAPERFNIFGEQTAELRSAVAPMVVNQPDALNLFAGTDGLLGEFTQFEQSQRLVGGARILSSAGRDPQHPAFVAYQLGKGTVVRVGTEAWASDLTVSPELTDVTRRTWSLLSR